MNESDRAAAVWKLFDEAVGLSPQERAAFIDVQCGKDAELRQELHSLLQHDLAAATGFLDASAAGAARADPTAIGPYRLGKKIGEGAFGVVYIAEQTRPVRRTVAVKILKQEIAAGQQSLARFEAERQALAVINHPNVARVFDAGTTSEHRPYFVMEYVPGEPITTHCDRRCLGIRDRLELFVHVCEAVQHAHTKGIIHRDLKPSNVLVCEQEGRAAVKVIDFGVAKAIGPRLTERTLMTEAGAFVGTPEYMSPEQAESGPADIDTRSDIYALGAMLYELLSGALPFDRERFRSSPLSEILRVIREVDPPSPSDRLTRMNGERTELARRRATAPATLVSQLRRELDWIPLKAMRKDRAQRYRTATELADDIENYLFGRPLIAGPESTWYRTRKLLKRNKGRAVAVVAVVAALVAGIIATASQATRAARAESRAVNQQHRAEEQADVAQAVSSFLGQMLSAADPDRLLGEKVTVLQATQEAIKKLDAGALKSKPQVEAAVRQTIGNTLRTLGRYDQAEQNLRAALELNRRSKPAGDQSIIDGLNYLVQLLIADGRLSEAEAFAREALTIVQNARPVDPAQIGRCVGNLAMVLNDEGKSAQAEPLARQALDAARNRGSAGDRDVLNALSDLARSLQGQGRLAEAEPYFRGVLEICQRTLPPRNSQLALATGNLGNILSEQGKNAEAEPLLRQCLQILRDVLPPGHRDLASFTSNLAAVLYDQGKLDEAEPLMRDALAMRRAALPAGHPDVAASLTNLGMLLQTQGKSTDAEPLLREALTTFRTALPPDHPSLAQAVFNLGVVLEAQKKPDDAQPLLREALAIWQKALPSTDGRIADASGLLGAVLTDQGKFSEAEPLLLTSYDAMKDDPAGRREAIERLVKLYEAWPEPDKAGKWRAELAALDATTRPATPSP